MTQQERRKLANKRLHDFLRLSHGEVEHICNVLFNEPNWSIDEDSQSIRWLIAAYLLIEELPKKAESTLTKEQRKELIRLCFSKVNLEHQDLDVKSELFPIVEHHCSQSENDFINRVETLPQNDNGGFAELIHLDRFRKARKLF